MRSAISIANFMLERAHAAERRELTANKLHDLVYLAHAWNLASAGEPLLISGVFAHHDGVILPALAEAGCYGGRRIDEAIGELKLDRASGFMREFIPRLDADDPLSGRIEAAWREWGHWPAYELRELTRAHGGPWDLVWNDESRSDNQPRRIPAGTIRLWFQGHLAQAGKIEAPKMKLGDTQAVLVQPDPRALRSA